MTSRGRVKLLSRGMGKNHEKQFLRASPYIELCLKCLFFKQRLTTYVGELLKLNVYNTLCAHVLPAWTDSICFKM